MISGALVLAGGFLALSGLGAVESWRHRKNLRRIPIRIHVNGTRGKSSVTRLIAAGLRAGGIRTCAKTTGTLPRMIFPDASEYPVFRPARSNIIEQLRVVEAAVAAGAEALVIECMAVHPRLQSVCELDIVQATHGVITNARADHLDVMGPTSRDVALALAGTVPCDGTLYTAEQRYIDVFSGVARDRRCRLVAIDDDRLAQIGWDDLAGFAHIEHPDNVALALAVCENLGVQRDVALRGMWTAPADPGVMSMYSVDDAGKQMTFVNGFAANDPESTGKNWNMVVDRFSGCDRRIALFNCRADRADRSVQLADACLRWKPADRYMLVGSATEVFARRALSNGMSPKRLICAERYKTPRVLDTLRGDSDRSAMIMGMGNINGVGLEIVDYFRSHNRRPTTQFTEHEYREAA